MPNVILPPFKALVNSKFVPIFECKDRYLLMWGSRNSSKSESACIKLIIRCVTEKYFRYILCRKVGGTIKDSMFMTIKDAIYRMNLQYLFTFSESPLEIRCVNGNKFLCRGLDDPGKLKSIKDPTGVWYEEANQITEKDFITVSTSIRSEKADYLQEILTFNPDCEGSYEDFWIYKKFFKTPDKYSFRGNIQVTDPETGQIYDNYYTSHHSTWRDNLFVSTSTKINLLSLTGYYKDVYSDGKWGRIITGNEFYHKFDRKGKNVTVTSVPYLPELPVHVSFDFNVLPFMTMICAQVEVIGNTWHIRFYKEYCLKPPSNSIEMCGAAFTRDHEQHRPNVFYYGDASGNNQIPGYGNKRAFDDVRLYLRQFLHHSSDKVHRANPGLFKRRDFINNIFDGKYDVKVSIDYSCIELIADLEKTMTTIQGKDKDRKEDKALQQSYEHRGHTSDAFDYLITKVLEHLWPYR